MRADQLAVIQHLRDLRPEGLPVRVGLEGGGQFPGPLVLQHAAKRLRETGLGDGARLGPQRIDIAGQGRRGGEAISRFVGQTGGVDRTCVICILDRGVGGPKPSGEVIGHIRITVAEFIRHGLRDLHL